MAVPASGVLDWYSLAQECYFGTYGSGTIDGCIAIKELVIGGQACSHAFTYSAVSGNAPPPDSSTPYAANEFYSYDKDFVVLAAKRVYTTSVPKPVFACGQTTTTLWYFPDSTPAVSDQVYTNSGGTTTPSAGNYGYCNTCIGNGTTDYRFTVNSSGIITGVASC